MLTVCSCDIIFPDDPNNPDNPGGNDKPGKNGYTASVQELRFPASGGEQTFTVTTKAKEWSAGSYESWHKCSVSGNYDLYLFSDEVYREFIYTKQPYISACHLEGIEENVILIDSLSKRYSECGIRIGALITKNKEVRLAYVLNKEDLSKAIFVLQKALEEYNRQNGQV